MRFRPVTTDLRSRSYFKTMRSCGCGASLVISKSRMKPSSLRIRAIASLTLEPGITTCFWRAMSPLWTRVNISAIGSLIIALLLSPARFDHAGQDTLQCLIAEADAAQTEAAHITARAPTHATAVAHTHFILASFFPVRHACLGHSFSSYRLPLPEGHAQELKQPPAFLIRLSRGADGHGHATDLVDLVILDLGPNELLPQTQAVVPTAIESIRRNAVKVTLAGEGNVHQPIQETPHTLATQGDHHADGVAFAQLEVRDGLPGLRDHRLLAGDDRHVPGGCVQRLGVLQGFAHPDVERYLLNARRAHHARVVEFLHQRRHDFLTIAFLQSRHLRHRSAPRTACIGGPGCRRHAPGAQPGRLATLRADQFYIGDVKRRLALANAEL